MACLIIDYYLFYFWSYLKWTVNVMGPCHLSIWGNNAAMSVILISLGIFYVLLRQSLTKILIY